MTSTFLSLNDSPLPSVTSVPAMSLTFLEKCFERLCSSGLVGATGPLCPQDPDAIACAVTRRGR